MTWDNAMPLMIAAGLAVLWILLFPRLKGGS